MEELLKFAKGPLFVVTFTFMVLALFRQIVMHATQIRESIKRLSTREVDVRTNIMGIIDWLIPVRHIYRNRPLISIVSFILHVCLLIVPIFLIDHIALWYGGLGIRWPGLTPLIADAMTLVAIAAVTTLLAYRILGRGARILSSFMDYFLLLLLSIPFVTGFMACHPAVNPLSYKAMMLIHILSAEMIFVLIPLTKLAHSVLFPFDRFSSDVFWKMPVGAGEKIANELYGEEACV